MLKKSVRFKNAASSRRAGPEREWGYLAHRPVLVQPANAPHESSSQKDCIDVSQAIYRAGFCRNLRPCGPTLLASRGSAIDLDLLSCQ